VWVVGVGCAKGGVKVGVVGNVVAEKRRNVSTTQWHSTAAPHQQQAI